MAKKSMLEREKKRRLLIKKYKEKRTTILTELRNLKKQSVSTNSNSIDLEKIFTLNKKLQKLPRNSSPIRLRNRCWKTGRPRGYNRFFGLCRNALRELAHECVLPGLTKASW